MLFHCNVSLCGIYCSIFPAWYATCTRTYFLNSENLPTLFLQVFLLCRALYSFILEPLWDISSNLSILSQGLFSSHYFLYCLSVLHSELISHYSVFSSLTLSLTLLGLEFNPICCKFYFNACFFIFKISNVPTKNRPTLVLFLLVFVLYFFHFQLKFPL